MFSKILSCVDGSGQSKRAHRYAVELAKKFGARLYVLHVVETKYAASPDMPFYPSVLEALKRNGEEVLRVALEEAVKEGVSAEAILEVGGDAAEAILEVAERLGVDLVVLGSRGLRGIARFLLGSVSERVARHSRSPVLIVH